MLLIEQIFEQDSIQSSYVKCPACKRGRLCDKAGYSKKFRQEHEADILLHQSAKKYFDELGLERLPTVKNLQSEYARLLSQKKELYPEYRKLRTRMKELLTVKANVDRLLNMQIPEEENEHQETHR